MNYEFTLKIVFINNFHIKHEFTLKIVLIDEFYINNRKLSPTLVLNMIDTNDNNYQKFLYQMRSINFTLFIIDTNNKNY